MTMQSIQCCVCMNRTGRESACLPLFKRASQKAARRHEMVFLDLLEMDCSDVVLSDSPRDLYSISDSRIDGFR